MRIEYDAEVDAAYIYLTDARLTAGRQSIELETPPDSPATVVMDWKNGKIAGLEVLEASAILHPDLLARAVPPGDSHLRLASFGRDRPEADPEDSDDETSTD